MKKVLALLVAAAVLATPAFAVIRNSKHDLSNNNLGPATITSTDYDETCVFCHTPHGARDIPLAPLWNRTITGVVTDLYNSATLDQTNSAPNVVAPAVALSDAPLCLSCHDGANTLNGGLVNPTNAVSGGPTFGGAGNLAGTAGDLNDATTGLTNDHPIGMDYDAVQGLDPNGFKVSNGGADVGGLPLYTSTAGGYQNVMWCSSCHDVHNQGAGTYAFLNMDNAGSALCTTCHEK